MYSLAWFLFTQGCYHVGTKNEGQKFINFHYCVVFLGLDFGLFPVFAILNHVAILLLIYVSWCNCAKVFMRCYKPMSGLLGFMLCI